MRTSLNKPIGLAEVAAHIEASSSYLSRAFHRECGVTLTEYLTRLRVDECKKLLAQDLSLKAIARQTGFAQYTYFLKVFKQATGMTPKQYRDGLHAKGKNIAVL